MLEEGEDHRDQQLKKEYSKEHPMYEEYRSVDTKVKVDLMNVDQQNYDRVVIEEQEE